MSQPESNRLTSEEQLRRIQERLARLEKAEEEKQLFVELSRRLAGATTVEAVTEAVCQASDRLLGWDFFYLAHRVSGDDRFRVVTILDTVDGRRETFPGHYALVSEFSEPVRQALGGRPLLINREAGSAVPHLMLEGTRRPSASLLFVPVGCEGQVIGLLSVQSYTPNRYNESDLQSLQDLADALAPALERIRAEESLRGSRDLLRIERDLALFLGSTSDLRAALGCLLEVGLRIEGMGCGAAYLVDPATGDLELVSHRGLSADYIAAVSHVSGQSRAAQLAATAESPFYLSESHLDEASRREGLRSLASTPIRHTGRTVAVLNLASRVHPEIPADTCSVIEAIAAQTGDTMARIWAEKALRETQELLEQKVLDRTAELSKSNQRLLAEMAERQAAERALVASERKHRLLIEMNAIGYSILDDQGCVRDANEEYVRLTGHRKIEEILGRPVTDWTAEEDAERNAEAVRKCLQSGFVRDLQITYRTGSDQRVHVEINATVLDTDEGRRILSLVRDITDRRHAEEALRASEERYRTLAEAAQDSIFIVDREDRVSYANSFAARQFGCTPEQLIGRRRVDLFPAEVALRQGRHLEQVFSQGVPLTFENVSEFAGRAAWLHTQLVPLKDAHGRVQAVLGIARDFTKMHQASEALKDSEARFRMLTEDSLMGVYIHQNNVFRYVNPALAAIVGYSREELMRVGAVELVHPDDRARVAELIRRRVEGEMEVAHFNFRMLRKSGEPVEVEALGRRIMYQGQPAIMGTLQDITERKRAEETLKDSEARFRMLTESSLVGVTIFQDGLFKYVNPAMAEMLGYGPEELLALEPIQLVQPEDRARVVELIRKRLEGETETASYASKLIHKSGNLVDVEALGRRIVYMGRPAILSTVLNITERKRAEGALRESEARVRLLLASTAEAIYGLDLDGRCTFCNPACLKMLGYANSSQLLGRELHSLIHHTRADGSPYPEAECRITEALRCGVGTHVDDEVLWRVDGSSFPAEYWAYPIRQDDRVIGAVVAFLDISERRKAEKALLQKEKELRRLGDKASRQLEEERAHISRMLHDELGQLLTALNLNLAWLARHTAKPSAAVKERFDESQQYMGRMIEVVRNLSKSLRPVALSHQGLVDAIRSHATEFSQYSSIPSEVKASPPDLEVGEPAATTAFRIVQEALTNVARHSKATACQISIKVAAGRLVVRVCDNGVGLPPKNRWRAGSLGILGMHERASMLGGKISVRNNRPRGTCVIIHLPLKAEKRSHAKP